MVNLLWAGMILIAIFIAGINGRIDIITQSIFSSAEHAVGIALSLISIIAFWLGIMKIIEKSGFINVVIFFFKTARALAFPGNSPQTQGNECRADEYERQFTRYGKCSHPIWNKSNGGDAKNESPARHGNR